MNRKIKISAAIVLAVLIFVYLVPPFIYQKCEGVYQQYLYRTFYVLREPFVILISFIVGLISVGVLLRGFLRRWVIAVIIVVLFFIVASAFLASLNTTRHSGRDPRRYTDIKQIQLALELYFDEYGRYPSILNELAGRFIPSVPRDPLSSKEYDYRLSGENTYVLRAVIEREPGCPQRRFGRTHPLWQDLDGEILGLQCDDPAYCVMYTKKRTGDVVP